MEELCERLDAMDAARAARGGGGGGGAGTSSEMTADMTPTPEESEEVREQHKRLLAEIRSCFRLLSIHSRLSGSESPRTRRIATQTDSCESLHSLAADRTKGNTPRVLRGLSPSEDAQNSLLYNQLIIESSSGFSGGINRSPDAAAAEGGAALSSCLGQQGGGGGEAGGGENAEEPSSEGIHQRLMVNPTSRLSTVVDLSNTDVINVVEWLFRDHPGAVWRAASRKAMEVHQDRKSLTYGEVSFVAFANLLKKYAPSQPSSGSPLSARKEKGKLFASSSQREDIFPCEFTFYDLGCGAGRPVYMAALLNTNCTKACGIEIVPNIHEMNKVLHKLYNLEVQPNLHPKKQSQKLDFLFGDFLQIDWSDADIIFTNATCFGDPVFSKFEEMAAKRLKIGAIVMSVTRPFSNLEPWELLERRERQMSWAPALVYVYRKFSHPPDWEAPSPSAVAESMVAPEPPSSTGVTAPDSIVTLQLSSNTDPTVKEPKTCDRGS